MSEAALLALVEGERALIAALDGDDVTAIEGATDAVARAAAALGPIDCPATPLVREAAALAEEARARIARLADGTQARLLAIAAATGRGNAGATYGRDARIRR